MAADEADERGADCCAAAADCSSDWPWEDGPGCLPNASIIVSAKSAEVHGDGEKVTGLSYEDRKSGEVRQLVLDGIFVQIRRVPNTEWLKGAIALTQRGEIEIDVGGETSLSGVFAAGDATIVPYKQIIVAAGEGAKAALSAFDYLIRIVPADAQAA